MTYVAKEGLQRGESVGLWLVSYTYRSKPKQKHNELKLRGSERTMLYENKHT